MKMIFSTFSKQYNSNFVTHEMSSGIYPYKVISEVLYTMGEHEGTLRIDSDDISLKTKPNLTRFGGTFGTLRFDRKSFFNTILGFTTYWKYKPTNASHIDRRGVYTSEKVVNLVTINIIYLKCDVINGSLINGVRQALLF